MGSSSSMVVSPSSSSISRSEMPDTKSWGSEKRCCRHSLKSSSSSTEKGVGRGGEKGEEGEGGGVDINAILSRRGETCSTGGQVENSKRYIQSKSKLQISEVCESVDRAEKDIRTCNDK